MGDKDADYVIEEVETSEAVLRRFPDMPTTLFRVVNTSGAKVPFDRYRTRERAEQRINRLKRFGSSV
jgi:hypothetical protein